MRLILYFILIIAPLVTHATALPVECESALKTLFAEKIDPKQASEFLRLQGEITLHRMAWAYLKNQKHTDGQKIESFQRTILELLNDKYTNENPEFIKARSAYEAQPLARSTLSDIGPYLKDALAHEFPDSDSAFLINESDLKLLAILSKKERESAVNGTYDARLFSSKSPQSILNFTKLIN
jgi:hypothetical protein